MKKLLCAMLGACMAFSFVACTPTDVDTTNYVATLKIGYLEAGYGTQFMTDWTEGYNEAHPDEQIKFDVDPNVSGSAIGNSLENSANLCDIYLCMATNWASWARRGWIEPLGDLFEMTNEDGVKFEDAFANGMEAYGKLDGERYVLPQSGMKATGFVYSEKLFEEHGWEIPETVDELFELVDTINNDPVNKDDNPNNDIAPFAWGGQVPHYWDSVVLQWANQIDGVEKLNEFYQNPTVEQYNPANREGLKKALQVYQQLICSGEGTPINSIEGAVSKNHLLMQNDFALGRAAMISGVYGIMNETKEIIDPDARLKMFFPAIEGAQTAEDGKPLIIGVASSFDFTFISKASTVKEYAKKFLLWISTKDMASAYIRGTGQNSPFTYNPEALGDDLHSLSRSLLEQTDDHFRAVIGASDHPLTQYGKILPWVTTTPYLKMVTDNWSPKKALDQQYQVALARWGEWVADSGME